MPSIQKDQSQWMKRVLLPVWILRLGITGILIVMYIIAVAVAVRIVKEGTNEGGLTPAEWRIGLGLAVLFLLLMIFVFLLDVLCVIKFLRHNLTPKFMLIINSIQVFVWLGLVGVEIYSVTKGGTKGGLAGSLIVTLSFVVLFVYSIIMFRRQKRGGQLGNYAQAMNPAHPQAFQHQQQQYAQQQEHGSVPFQTGAYNPYAANTSYQGAHGAMELDQKPPATGAAADYYNGTRSHEPFPDASMQPVEPKSHI